MLTDLKLINSTLILLEDLPLSLVPSIFSLDDECFHVCIFTVKDSEVASRYNTFLNI